MTKKVLDLFCGAGGYSEGFKQAGFEIITAVDNDQLALKTHEINHPNTIHLNLEVGKEDISEIIELGPYDIIIGSPPCQNLSLANAKRNIYEGLYLVNEFFKIIDELNPRYWIGENVKHAQKYIEFIFEVQGKVYNSFNFGVPQNRFRYFFGNFNEPVENDKKLVVLDILEEIDDWLKFDDLSSAAKRRFEEDYPKNVGFPHSKLIIPTKPINTITAHKDNAYMLLLKLDCTETNGCGVKSIDNPLWTQVTKINQVLVNPEKFLYRHFTINELKKLMGFPTSYVFEGNKSQKIKQIGNAVCPPMAKALATSLYEGYSIKTNPVEAYF